MRISTHVLFPVFLAVCAPAVALAADVDLAARIARVESGLLPPARITGTSSDAWTLAARQAFYHVPAVSIAVIADNAIAWTRAYGTTRADSATAASTETLFQAASLSKTITAAAALAVVESGRLVLDADVNLTLAAWKAPASPADDGELVTLRRLLSHTAGFNINSFTGYAPGAPLPSLTQILAGTPPANSVPLRLIASPGRKWQYSAGGYCVVQQLLAETTGEPFPAFVESRVLAPVGMTSSSFEQPLSAALQSRAAAGHDIDGHPLAGGARIFPELAAAGLWTTPADLARFLLALQHSLAGNGTPTLFSRATAETMLTVPLAGSDYALGVGVKNSGETLQLSHTGANAGFRAIYVFYPRLGRGAVIMTNSDNGGALIPEILRSLAREYDWPDYRVVEKPAVSLPPAAFDDFAGRYERNETVLVFYRKENHFYVRATNTPRVEIFPKSNHEFFELAGNVVYTFERDEILRVTHVVRSDPSPQLFRRTDPAAD